MSLFRGEETLYVVEEVYSKSCRRMKLENEAGGE